MLPWDDLKPIPGSPDGAVTPPGAGPFLRSVAGTTLIRPQLDNGSQIPALIHARPCLATPWRGCAYEGGRSPVTDLAAILLGLWLRLGLGLGIADGLRQHLA